MKKLIWIFALSLAMVSCKDEAKITENELEVEKDELAYATFGMEINDDDALSTVRMIEKYKGLKAGDTLITKMKGKIVEVCSKKGCWMTLDAGNDETIMVKFKDYGFFMPLNAEGDVVINGKAYVAETSVDELRHYAEDAGKSKEEIEAITASKLEYHFEADGVLLQQ